MAENLKSTKLGWAAVENFMKQSFKNHSKAVREGEDSHMNMMIPKYHQLAVPYKIRKASASTDCAEFSFVTYNHRIGVQGIMMLLKRTLLSNCQPYLPVVHPVSH
jgi:hypothetical protein